MTQNKDAIMNETNLPDWLDDCRAYIRKIQIWVTAFG